MLVIGIDPGSASGAVAWLHAEGRAAVHDLPLIAGAIDPHALRSLLLERPAGAAFGGAVQAVTAEAMVYVGGLRRYRAIINNDGGAVPIWELASDPPNEGNAA